MAGEVTLRSEPVGALSCCELAALLVTMGYQLSPNSYVCGGDTAGGCDVTWKIVDGSGLTGEPLNKVLGRGLAVDQPPGPQRWIAGGVRAAHAALWARLSNVQGVLPGKRVEGGMVVYEDVRGGLDGQSWALSPHHGLEATLLVLGFDVTTSPVLGGDQVEVKPGLWSSRTEKWSGAGWDLSAVVMGYEDDLWCGRPENFAPVAALSCFFGNLRVLRELVMARRPDLYRVAQGKRVAYIGHGADDSVWRAAERFLTR
ncbi:MAG: hypothetical protein Q3986_06550 [Akkermansia sp.]|nr:hypothetical protein [Akkermansia sp.]